MLNPVWHDVWKQEKSSSLEPLRGNFYKTGQGVKIAQWTISSATTFLEKCRKVVREIWFEKSCSLKVIDQKKKVGLYYKSTFFQVREKWLARKKIWVCRTTFLEPLFYTFLEKWLQIK